MRSDKCQCSLQLACGLAQRVQSSVQRRMGGDGRHKGEVRVE